MIIRLLFCLMLFVCSSVFAYDERTYIPIYNNGTMQVSVTYESLVMDEKTLQMEAHGLIEFTPAGKQYEDYRTGLKGIERERFTYNCDVLMKRGRFSSVTFYDMEDNVLAIDREGTPWQENDVLYLQIVDAAEKYRTKLNERKAEIEKERKEREEAEKSETVK